MSALNVLIVDDDPAIVRAIDLRLRKAGFNTLFAYDGREGLAIAQREAPDAVLMDLRMPVMDGFTMLEKLQNSVHTARIPAIILSADSADRARLRVLRSGATFFVEKPYRAEDLMQALNVALAPARGPAPGDAKHAGNSDAHHSSPETHQTPEERAHKMATSSEINVPRNRKILIADDDPAVVRALSVRCKKLGLEVDTAENGLQAILKAQRSNPRLLILDINMPEADGFRVCEWLLDPQRPPVDVVVLTGRDDSDTLGRCDSFGAFYVQKNNETWDAIKDVLVEVLQIEDAAFEAVGHTHLAHIAEAEINGQSKPKILVVDDDMDLTRALARRLAKCGAETLTASNGVEAYRIAVREKPNVVIADYGMPEGGGHYLLWRLKSTEATQHIPIIIITGQRLEPGTDSPLTRETKGRGGAVALLRKPLDNNALFAELGRHCQLQYRPN